jgi:hypothetical protein
VIKLDIFFLESRFLLRRKVVDLVSCFDYLLIFLKIHM